MTPPPPQPLPKKKKKKKNTKEKKKESAEGPILDLNDPKSNKISLLAKSSAARELYFLMTM